MKVKELQIVGIKQVVYLKDKISIRYVKGYFMEFENFEFVMIKDRYDNKRHLIHVATGFRALAEENSSISYLQAFKKLKDRIKKIDTSIIKEAESKAIQILVENGLIYPLN